MLIISKIKISLRYAAFSALLLVVSQAGFPLPQETVEVSIQSEIWHGARDTQYPGIEVYKGLPYAKAPIGDLRWRAPQAYQVTKGKVFSAKKFAPACIQSQRLVAWDRKILRAFDLDEKKIPSLERTSEDCLHLNVWTPSLKISKDLPVMVWIYGGSNRAGWSNQIYYDGASLAERGVVLVTINYRVGVMGWMAHPALSARSQNRVSGNYGTLDQIAALKWVRDNITQFGGDPNRVTIFGESAGARNVSTLLSSPLAEGLFHRAIMQSTGFREPRTLLESEVIGKKIAESLAGDIAHTTRQQLQVLLEADPFDVMEHSNKVRGNEYYGPTKDAYVLPTSPMTTFRSKAEHPVPIMIGANRNEWSLFQRTVPDATALQKAIDYYQPELTSQKALKKVLAEHGSIPRQHEKLLTNAYFVCPSKTAATHLSRRDEPVYMYYFTREREGAKIWVGAYHAAELPYVFDTNGVGLPVAQEDRNLTRAMGEYWTNFATFGNPNGIMENKASVNWDRFDASKGNYLELGDQVQMASTLESQMCQLLSDGS
jgi:para-nitrobenzyl esterase